MWTVVDKAKDTHCLSSHIFRDAVVSSDLHRLVFNELTLSMGSVTAGRGLDPTFPGLGILFLRQLTHRDFSQLQTAYLNPVFEKRF